MATLTKAEAESITQEIVASHKLTVELIIEAYQGKAHKALGYTNWEAYCEDRLPEDVRYSREEVVRMKNAGLSGRAIAAVARMGKSTVNDLVKSTVGRNRPGDEEVRLAPVVGMDGKRYDSNPVLMERRVKVATLAADGFSNVTIAERVGVTEATVRRDLKAVGVPSSIAGPTVGAACKPLSGAGIQVFAALDNYAKDARDLLDSLKDLEEEYGKYHHLTTEQFTAWRNLITALEVFETEFLKSEKLPEGMEDYDA